MEWPAWVLLPIAGAPVQADGMPENPVILCVLLWAKLGKETALSAYEDQVLGLLADHGGRVLQRGSVIPGGGNGERPAEVQFLEFPSQESLDAYMNDSRRLALAADRDAAIARTDVLRVGRR
jgi:uncharacterized protein (DUF1330 family)